ncbi:MAG: hypothetical protein L0Y64_25360 [Myxococcaceae bacterium]|nr:hypothetical protein [Myxococcaceae bacterium]
MEPPHRQHCAAALTLLLTLGSAATSHAEDASAMEGVRTLRGHTFLFPTLQDTAFVTTTFGVRTGVSQEQTDHVPLGSVGRVDVRLLGYEQAFDFGLAFTRWLGLDITASGGALLGGNAGTLAVEGGTLAGRLRVGPRVRLWRDEQLGTQVTVAVNGGIGSVPTVSLLPLLTSFTASPARTIASILRGNLKELLLVPGTERRLDAALLLAQAFGPVASLQGSVGVRGVYLTESPFNVETRRREDHFSRTRELVAALALGLDAESEGLPLGALVEYAFSAGVAEDPPLPDMALLGHTVSAGLFYTGRRDLQWGVVGIFLLRGRPLTGVDADGLPAESERPSFSSAQAVLRYVW